MKKLIEILIIITITIIIILHTFNSMPEDLKSTILGVFLNALLQFLKEMIELVLIRTINECLPKSDDEEKKDVSKDLSPGNSPGEGQANANEIIKGNDEARECMDECMKNFAVDSLPIVTGGVTGIMTKSHGAVTVSALAGQFVSNVIKSYPENKSDNAPKEEDFNVDDVSKEDFNVNND